MEKQRFGLKDKFLLWLVSLVGPLLLLVYGKTWRISRVGTENLREVRERGGKVLYAFWHKNILPLAYSHRRRGIHIMISEHRDGEFIARVVKRLGYHPVRGSTTRGGSRALFKMSQVGKGGFDGAITPDGPKGPKRQVQPGTVVIASRATLPVVPGAAAASSCWVLKSWDDFLIPKPLSKVVILVGKPMHLPTKLNEADIEHLCRELKERLDQLEIEAQSLSKGA
jgi:lysophospholipid acyltransferase (LPLAT)-like uncharacterized protein